MTWVGAQCPRGLGCVRVGPLPLVQEPGVFTVIGILGSQVFLGICSGVYLQEIGYLGVGQYGHDLFLSCTDFLHRGRDPIYLDISGTP